MPIYDFLLLPIIKHPFNNINEKSKQYLGNREIYGDNYVNISLHIKDNDEAERLYDFWETECDNGTLPFLIPIPVNGEEYDRDTPNTTAKFIGEIKMQKVGFHWESSFRLEIL
jgi:hypothetical protein